MSKRKLLGRIAFGIALIFVVSLALPYLLGGKVKTLTAQTAELETLLGDMAWVSPGLSDERALYEISFRTCGACISYHKTEFPKLQAMGVDTRLFVFPRQSRRTPPEERAVVAELYKTRSWQLSEDWYAHSNPKRYYGKMQNIPDADGDAARTALVETGQRQIRQLMDILTANDITMATPTLLWQNEAGQWRVAIGNNPVSNVQIRKELGGAK